MCCVVVGDVVLCARVSNLCQCLYMSGTVAFVRMVLYLRGGLSFIRVVYYYTYVSLGFSIVEMCVCVVAMTLQWYGRESEKLCVCVCVCVCMSMRCVSPAEHATA
jgi:hypothetical protein